MENKGAKEIALSSCLLNFKQNLELENLSILHGTHHEATINKGIANSRLS